MFGDPKTQPNGCRCFSPGASPSPILLIPFSFKIDPLGIKCLTFYVMHAILDSQWHGDNTATCHCEVRISSPTIPVVKIAPHRPKLQIEDGKTSASIDLYLNTSLRRILVCPHGSGMCIILPTPLGQLFCGLPLGGEACTGCRTSSLLQQKVDQFMSRHALEPCI